MPGPKMFGIAATRTVPGGDERVVGVDLDPVAVDGVADRRAVHEACALEQPGHRLRVATMKTP